MLDLERLDLLFAMSHPQVFWRHDVDVSPRAAVEMARFERERGVRATFFVMTTSPFYTRAEAVRLVEQVEELGHHAGWHVDLRETGLHEIDGWCDVSFHVPPIWALWVDIPGFRSAYGAAWKGRYVSDSRGRFDHEQPEEMLADRLPCQISLHAEHWFDRGWEQRIDPDTYLAFFHEPHPALVAA